MAEKAFTRKSLPAHVLALLTLTTSAIVLPAPMAFRVNVQPALAVPFWQALFGQRTVLTADAHENGLAILIRAVLAGHGLVIGAAQLLFLVKVKVAAIEAPFGAMSVAWADKEFNGFLLKVGIKMVVIESAV